MTANTAIHRELQRLGKLAASYAKKQESQAGRLEKRLGALQDWTENLLEKDAVRRAHVRLCVDCAVASLLFSDKTRRIGPAGSG
jgi:hypothetical protein